MTMTRVISDASPLYRSPAKQSMYVLQRPKLQAMSLNCQLPTRGSQDLHTCSPRGAACGKAAGCRCQGSAASTDSRGASCAAH